MNEKYENETLHKMYTEAMQENAQLKNIIGCLKPQLKSMIEYAKDLRKDNEELQEKLSDAKRWLIRITDNNENRSDFERYMLKEFGYEN